MKCFSGTYLNISISFIPYQFSYIEQTINKKSFARKYFGKFKLNKPYHYNHRNDSKIRYSETHPEGTLTTLLTQDETMTIRNKIHFPLGPSNKFLFSRCYCQKIARKSKCSNLSNITSSTLLR